MIKFTQKRTKEILTNHIDTELLIAEYPNLKESVLKQFSMINGKSSVNEIVSIINKYKAKASFANDKIRSSGQNTKTTNFFLPDIIEARIAIYMLEQIYRQIQSGKVLENASEKVRFNLWDGIILQHLLFKKDLERKAVSMFLFKLIWIFVTNKKILMPLVSEKGIYCFYSKELIREIAMLIGDSRVIEIGAGDGTLTSLLNDTGVKCKATDDYSWANYIKYPDFVEGLDAKAALQKYKPEKVLCSWPPPGNNFEKYIFQTDSVKQYIVIGSKSPLVTGNHEIYKQQKKFTMEYSEILSSLLIPPSEDNGVYIFRAKTETPLAVK